MCQWKDVNAILDKPLWNGFQFPEDEMQFNTEQYFEMKTITLHRGNSTFRINAYRNHTIEIRSNTHNRIIRRNFPFSIFDSTQNANNSFQNCLRTQHNQNARAPYSIHKTYYEQISIILWTHASISKNACMCVCVCERRILLQKT